MGDEGEDDDDDEDSEKEDDEVPTFGKDGRPQGQTPLYEAPTAIDDGYAGEGSVIDQQGVGLYCTGPSPTAAGVLLVSDLFGWNSGRTRHVADYVAKSLNAFTVVPRLLDSPPMEGGTDGDGLPEGFDKAGPAEQWREADRWVGFLLWHLGSVQELRDDGRVCVQRSGLPFGAPNGRPHGRQSDPPLGPSPGPCAFHARAGRPRDVRTGGRDVRDRFA